MELLTGETGVSRRVTLSGMEETRPSLVKRALAAVILIAAAYVLLKLVIGFVTAIAGTVVAIVAVVAIIWAIRVL